MKLIIVVIERT